MRWKDKSYFSLTFMWESNKYRKDTYHLQKSFSKFVMDGSYFSLTFMWESNKYREDTYYLQKSFSKFVMDKSYFSLTFVWESNKYRKIHTTWKSNFQSLWKIDSWVVPSIQLDTKVHGTLWTASTPNSSFTSMSLYYQISQSFTMICHLIE